MPCCSFVYFFFKPNNLSQLQQRRLFFRFRRTPYTHIHVFVFAMQLRAYELYTYIIYIITLHIFVCHSFDLFQYIVTKFFFAKNRLNAKQHQSQAHKIYGKYFIWHFLAYRALCDNWVKFVAQTYRFLSANLTFCFTIFWIMFSSVILLWAATFHIDKWKFAKQMGSTLLSLHDCGKCLIRL